MTPGEPPTDPPGPAPAAAPPKHCPGPTKRGVSCIYALKPGESHCWNHDPRRAAERKAAGAIRRQPGDLGAELGTLDSIARRAAGVLEKLEEGFVGMDGDGNERFVSTLEPAQANARIATLRFLASLVQLRREKKRGADGDAAPDLKELFG